MKYDIVALYVCIDDFSKIYEEWEEKKLIGKTKNRKREGKLSMSEQLLIVILYHLEGFKNFKYYYKYAVEITEVLTKYWIYATIKSRIIKIFFG